MYGGARNVTVLLHSFLGPNSSVISTTRRDVPNSMLGREDGEEAM